MKPAIRVLLLAFLLAFSGFAQTFVVSQPDCIIFFHFTATGQASPTSPNNGLDNRTTGCTTWAVSATSVTFTGATITLQSAPNTSSGVPGTYVTFANATALQNANPITVSSTPAAGFFSLIGYNPWVRVLFTVTGGPATGVVDGAAFGWRIPSAGTSSSATQDVTIVSPIGQMPMADSVAVAIASDQSAVKVNGQAAAGAAAVGNPNLVGGTDASGNVEVPKVDPQGNTYQYLGCDSQAEVSLSGTGYTQIVAASGSTVIRVCKLFVTSASGGTPVVNTFNIAFGSCAGSPTEIQTAAGVTGIDEDYSGALKGAAGAALCVKEGTANSDKVMVTYGQH